MQHFATIALVLATTLTTSVTSFNIDKAAGDYPCGSILNDTNGILQYKPFEQVGLRERCVWILRVPAATGYNITLYNLGYSGRSDGLHIAGVYHGAHTLEFVSPSSIDRNYFVNGSVAILTFYSGTSAPLRGFSLHWTAYRTSNPNVTEVSLNSATEIVSTTSRNISHPKLTSGLDNYDNNELSTFLFTPEFTAFDQNTYINEIQFVQMGLQGITCNDFVDVFTFKLDYSSPTWVTYGRFCGPDTDVTFSATDMVLLVFQSDASETNSGFDLIYQRK